MTVCALCPWRTEEDARLLKVVIVIVSERGQWNPNSGHLHEQYVLSVTELSLQHPYPAGFVFDFLNWGG